MYQFRAIGIHNLIAFKSKEYQQNKQNKCLIQISKTANKQMHQKSNLEVDYTNQFGIDQCLSPRIKHNEKQQKWQTSRTRIYRFPTYKFQKRKEQIIYNDHHKLLREVSIELKKSGNTRAVM